MAPSVVPRPVVHHGWQRGEVHGLIKLVVAVADNLVEIECVMQVNRSEDKKKEKKKE